jgi:hypothetical protein
LLDVFYIQVRYAGKSLNEKDNFQKLIEQVFIQVVGCSFQNV